jgi:hypothetical protein
MRMAEGKMEFFRFLYINYDFLRISKYFLLMKKLILSIIFIAPFVAFAQSATILPNSIQLPNVSTLGTCTTEKKGQLVLLTTDNQTYYCNGTAWVTLLTVATDSPWLVNGTNINNGNTGNVGIGIASPTRDLVINSFLSPDILIQQGTFTGNTSTDGFMFGTNTLFDGEIWNFETGGIRFGTSNLERMKITSNGNVGIGNSSPAEKLDVVGNIKVSGEVNRAATGATNLVPIAYGTLQDNGNILTTSGNWTLTHTDNSGIWTIDVTSENITLTGYALIATSNANFPSFVIAQPVSNNLQVKTYTSAGTLQDIGFSFVIYKP